MSAKDAAVCIGTLEAATPADVDFDVSNSRSVCLIIENTGVSNALGTTVVKKSADGTNFGTDSALGTAIGSIAASGIVLVELTDVAFKTLRLTLTSTNGTTYRLTMRGT